jgi:hypothetical protein
LEDIEQATAGALWAVCTTPYSHRAAAAAAAAFFKQSDTLVHKGYTICVEMSFQLDFNTHLVHAPSHWRQHQHQPASAPPLAQHITSNKHNIHQKRISGQPRYSTWLIVARNGKYMHIDEHGARCMTLATAPASASFDASSLFYHNPNNNQALSLNASQTLPLAADHAFACA